MSSLLSFFVLYHLILLFTWSPTISGMFSEQSPNLLTTKRIEKTTHLHFYLHDTVQGKNPSAEKIIKPPSSSSGGFGVTFMADDPLTEGPEPSSKLVGRAQGMYALASKHDVALLMVMNFAFTEGIYNGSTLGVLGRNSAMENVREMPIVGGSGVFRFGRGYALAKTVWFDAKSRNAVVEYNVTVSHY